MPIASGFKLLGCSQGDCRPTARCSRGEMAGWGAPHRAGRCSRCPAAAARLPLAVAELLLQGSLLWGKRAAECRGHGRTRNQIP